MNLPMTKPQRKKTVLQVNCQRNTKMCVSPHLGLPTSEVAPRCQASTPPPLSIVRFPTRPPGCDALRCHHARHVELDTRRGRSRSSWRRDQRINSAEAPFLLRRRTRWLEADRDGRVGFSAAPFAVERQCDGEVGIVAPLGPRSHRYTQHARRPIQTALVATVAAASAVVDGWGIASAASPPFSAPLSAMCLMGDCLPPPCEKSERPLRFFGGQGSRSKMSATPITKPT